MVWLNVADIRLTSLSFGAKHEGWGYERNGLVVLGRQEVRVPNARCRGAVDAPTVRSALHRVANPCVASRRRSGVHVDRPYGTGGKATTAIFNRPVANSRLPPGR
ncbi:hypothetical protein SGFS_064930 [Streptomyces graminofaciens]|uniref:Uncharacterized protein n=1 Tax=Streptomyces graminofaciens TaxID=68212 RepID=A0ABM7FFM5_9ACTN|nr:hypothetical protein SGFS_064930 [Streptomyces graminofaciens]